MAETPLAKSFLRARVDAVDVACPARSAVERNAARRRNARRPRVDIAGLVIAGLADASAAHARAGDSRNALICDDSARLSGRGERDECRVGAFANQARARRALRARVADGDLGLTRAARRAELDEAIAAVASLLAGARASDRAWSGRLRARGRRIARHQKIRARPVGQSLGAALSSWKSKP